MPEAYIVDALRSPTGKRKGALIEVHAIDLGAHVLKALVERNAIPGEDYDDVILAVSTPLAPRLVILPVPVGSPPGCR